MEIEIIENTIVLLSTSRKEPYPQWLGSLNFMGKVHKVAAWESKGTMHKLLKVVLSIDNKKTGYAKIFKTSKKGKNPDYRGLMTIYRFKSKKHVKPYEFEIALWYGKGGENKKLLRGLFNIKGQPYVSYNKEHARAYQPESERLPVGMYRPPDDLPF